MATYCSGAGSQLAMYCATTGNSVLALSWVSISGSEADGSDDEEGDVKARK